MHRRYFFVLSRTNLPLVAVGSIIGNSKRRISDALMFQLVSIHSAQSPTLSALGCSSSLAPRTGLPVFEGEDWRTVTLCGYALIYAAHARFIFIFFAVFVVK